MNPPLTDVIYPYPSFEDHSWVIYWNENYKDECLNEQAALNGISQHYHDLNKDRLEDLGL